MNAVRGRLSSFSFFFFFSFLVRGPAAGRTGPGRGGRGSGAEGGGEGRVSLENGCVEHTAGIPSFRGDCGGQLLGPAISIKESLSLPLRSLGSPLQEGLRNQTGTLAGTAGATQFKKAENRPLPVLSGPEGQQQQQQQNGGGRGINDRVSSGGSRVKPRLRVP